jgi:riboflavin synthase
MCVDGVSLTVNTVTGDEFSINLIPHTLENTTLKLLSAGSHVNFEVDQIARYVERMTEWQQS